MTFEQLFWGYIGFAIGWLISGFAVWFWLQKRLSSYKSQVESYRYEIEVLNDRFATFTLKKAEAEKRAETLIAENASIESSLSKRQLILIERENEIKNLTFQNSETDGKLESLRQEVFRKTEQIDVLHRQVEQKSTQLQQFENELEVQKTYVAQLHLKSGENLSNPLLVEKNNQIATLHTQLSELLPLESKVALQNEEIDYLRIEKQKLQEELEDKKIEFRLLHDECEECKSEVLRLTDSEETAQLLALMSENRNLREELEKQSERMN